MSCGDTTHHDSQSVKSDTKGYPDHQSERKPAPAKAGALPLAPPPPQRFVAQALPPQLPGLEATVRHERSPGRGALAPSSRSGLWAGFRVHERRHHERTDQRY
jgi:hypothetical protein